MIKLSVSGGPTRDFWYVTQYILVNNPVKFQNFRIFSLVWSKVSG